jgi:colanic acid biosynthesis glycosyl transferase WcaI
MARRFRPDLVLVIAPSMISVPVARLVARLAGAKLWIHVQDFEVEAAFATGLLHRDSAIGRLAGRFEAAQLRAADRVSSISPQMCRKLVEKGVPAERVVEFRNWAEIDAIRPLAEASPYRAMWDIAAPHVAFYSGNIANKQGIEIIIDAARLLADRRDLAFVVCGNGPNRDRLVAAARGLDNILFHDLQPRERLSDLLGLATVHLLPQIAGAADLVLPSKMANMLASGRPVVATADPGTGLAREVEDCGLITAPGDAAGFAGAIRRLLDDEGLRARLGANARRRAEERWSRNMILARFERELRFCASDATCRPDFVAESRVR